VVKQPGTPQAGALPPRFFEDLLAALGHAAIATDLDGLVTYWNPAAEDLYGYCAADVLGHPLTDLIVPVAGRARAAELAALLESRTPVTGRCRTGSAGSSQYT
jgi:PAS domain S-box-containing protein